jgi:hypothetical protein
MLCYLHALVSQCQPTSNKDSDQDAIQTSGDNLLTWVTWWLISVGPDGSSLEMLLASVASARASHQSRKSIKRVQA